MALRSFKDFSAEMNGFILYQLLVDVRYMLEFNMEVENGHELNTALIPPFIYQAAHGELPSEWFKAAQDPKLDSLRRSFFPDMLERCRMIREFQDRVHGDRVREYMESLVADEGNESEVFRWHLALGAEYWMQFMLPSLITFTPLSPEYLSLLQRFLDYSSLVCRIHDIPFPLPFHCIPSSVRCAGDANAFDYRGPALIPRPVSEMDVDRWLPAFLSLQQPPSPDKRERFLAWTAEKAQLLGRLCFTYNLTEASDLPIALYQHVKDVLKALRRYMTIFGLPARMDLLLVAHQLRYRAAVEADKEDGITGMLHATFYRPSIRLVGDEDDDRLLIDPLPALEDDETFSVPHNALGQIHSTAVSQLLSHSRTNDQPETFSSNCATNDRLAGIDQTPSGSGAPMEKAHGEPPSERDNHKKRKRTISEEDAASAPAEKTRKKSNDNRSHDKPDAGRHTQNPAGRDIAASSLAVSSPQLDTAAPSSATREAFRDSLTPHARAHWEAGRYPYPTQDFAQPFATRKWKSEVHHTHTKWVKAWEQDVEKKKEGKAKYPPSRFSTTEHPTAAKVRELGHILISPVKGDGLDFATDLAAYRLHMATQNALNALSVPPYVYFDSGDKLRTTVFTAPQMKWLTLWYCCSNAVDIRCIEFRSQTLSSRSCAIGIKYPRRHIGVSDIMNFIGSVEGYTEDARTNRRVGWNDDFRGLATLWRPSILSSQADVPSSACPTPALRSSPPPDERSEYSSSQLMDDRIETPFAPPDNIGASQDHRGSRQEAVGETSSGSKSDENELIFATTLWDSVALCPFCDSPLRKPVSRRLAKLLDAAMVYAVPERRHENPDGVKAPLQYYAGACALHRSEEAMRDAPGSPQRWPKHLNYHNIEQRLRQHRRELERIVSNPTCSEFYRQARATYDRLGHRVGAGLTGQWETHEICQPG
ncbi:hypothetical protein CALCODRAFT_539186 [Calocera cornea HHB12733]|uniref:Restriction of telomere capping protein 4 n=1 Tax=Calocera cornea HHB12733 TaxID=1353952 RepID=A0A165BZK3_9BASI|nr:hypothetical protein CALCODRAFT_539186 [Calocera cornea HHB12733]